jgi:hypothetical protein
MENESEIKQKTSVILSYSYYLTYNGHEIRHLNVIYDHLRQQGIQEIIYLAGDSSLDNKFWLKNASMVPAAAAYANVLHPAKSYSDICYWINKNLEERQKHKTTACMMTSVEETTLKQRLDHGLLPQDVFIRDHMQPQDTLIVSIGGNDIALAPTIRTILHLANLLFLSPSFWLTYNPSFRYFVNLFKDSIEKYLRLLTAKNKPKRIMVCMIYYPCEIYDEHSWSKRLLSLTGYDRNPKHLQHLINSLFEHATKQIQLEGCEIIPIALFDVLDAKNPDHYVQRVEPSESGGKLMADYFCTKIY